MRRPSRCHPRVPHLPGVLHAPGVLLLCCVRRATLPPPSSNNYRKRALGSLSERIARRRSSPRRSAVAYSSRRCSTHGEGDKVRRVRSLSGKETSVQQAAHECNLANLGNLPRSDRHCRGNGTDYQLGCTRGGEPCRVPRSLLPFSPRAAALSLFLSFLSHSRSRIPDVSARRPRDVRGTGTVAWARPIRASRRASRVPGEWALFRVASGPIADPEVDQTLPPGGEEPLLAGACRGPPDGAGCICSRDYPTIREPVVGERGRSMGQTRRRDRAERDDS